MRQTSVLASNYIPMRSLVFLLLPVLLLSALNSSAQRRKKKDKTAAPVAAIDTTPSAPSAALPNAPVIKFDTLEYNFGMAKEGQVVKFIFRFRNEGSKPLQLTNVRPGCGCTTPDWPKDPIKSGETGEIKVSFNTAGKLGPQLKQIEVFANTEPPHVLLSFKGEVVSEVVPVKDN